jgi:hypothetical protein
MSMKNSNDTIGNRTRDLLACKAVPKVGQKVKRREKKKVKAWEEQSFYNVAGEKFSEEFTVLGRGFEF